MAKMHTNEFSVDDSLVRKLISSQCPQWQHLSIVPIQSSGTDNALFRLGDEWVVRLPRIDWATKSIQKEYDWLPKLSKLLNHAMSVPVFRGEPEHGYPWSWLISPWYEGHNPPFEQKNEYAELSLALASFLNGLHAIHLENGPFSRRGVHLKAVADQTLTALNALASDMDVKQLKLLWHELEQVPQWHNTPVWVHGDFLPGNIIVFNTKLQAVIDFSDVGIGDPACDCIMAWSLLNQKSREIFKSQLNNIDEDTWLRGKGWALSIAAIMLPYYKNTNPTLATLARRILAQIQQSK